VGTAWGVPGLSRGAFDEDRRGGDYTRYGALARDVARRPTCLVTQSGLPTQRAVTPEGMTARIPAVLCRSGQAALACSVTTRT
jgi:hypothetical protein